MVGAATGALLISSGLFVGQAFAELLAVTSYGLGPFVLLVLATVLFALIVLIVYVTITEGVSPYFLSSFVFIGSGIPAIKLPQAFSWFFVLFGTWAASDPVAQ